MLEERRARPGWGADPSVEFLGAFKSGKLLPVTRLNEGFVRPSHRDEIGFSYYQASLLCEMIEQQWGRAALVAMLHGYRDGLETPAVFSKVLGLTPDALNARFAAFMRQKFATALAAIAPWNGTGPGAGEFVNAMRAGGGAGSSGQAGRSAGGAGARREDVPRIRRRRALRRSRWPGCTCRAGRRPRRRGGAGAAQRARRIGAGVRTLRKPDSVRKWATCRAPRRRWNGCSGSRPTTPPSTPGWRSWRTRPAM